MSEDGGVSEHRSRMEERADDPTVDEAEARSSNVIGVSARRREAA
jgi:hypothetical protein